MAERSERGEWTIMISVPLGDGFFGRLGQPHRNIMAQMPLAWSVQPYQSAFPESLRDESAQ